MRIDWQRRLPVLILTAAVLVLFYRLLFGQVIYWGTPLLQFYPWRAAAFDALRAGRLPLWNPLVGHGAPLLANYQTAVFYPPNWLYLLIPAEYAMGWIGLLHLVWAGIGMAAYLRRLGVDRLGQGMGMLAFALSTWIVGRFGFLSITSAYPWLPWLLWAVEGVVAAVPDRCTPYRRAALLAGVTAMLLLAGHAQTAFYGLIFAGAYAVYRAVQTGLSAGVGGITLPLGLALGGVLIGVMLAAVQLLPTFELMQTSQRSAGVAPEVALAYSFWPWRALSLIAPGMFGSPASGDYWGYANYWEDAVYVGLLPLLLAGRAVSVRWRDEGRGGQASPAGRVVPFFALSLAPVAIFALGWHTPIFVWLFEYVPTFNLFNAPTRWLVLAVLSLSILGGIGADNWQTRQRGRAWAGRGVAIGLAMLGASLAAGSLLAGVYPSIARAMARLGLTIGVVSGLGLLLYRAERAASPVWRARWEGLALLVLAVDLAAANWGLNPATDAAYYQQRSALANVLPAGTRSLYLPADEYAAKFDVFLRFDDFHADDADRWGALRDSLLPNLGMIDGVPSGSNFDPLLVGHHTDLLAAVEAMAPAEQVAWLRRLNVGLLLAPTPRSDLEQIGEAGAVRAYAVPDPYPRSYLGECAVADDRLICEPDEAGSVEMVRDEAQRVDLRVEAAESAMLVLTDTDYPGWSATVDGEQVPIQRVNGAFRGVGVAAGEHDVSFVYRPASLGRGAIISGAAFLVVLGLLGLGRRSLRPAQSRMN